MSFVGEKEIKEIVPVPGKENLVKVIFDEGETEINKDLLELITIEEKGNGNVTDNINHYFTRKFVAELSQYDLGFYFTNSIGIGIETLAHNLREELIRKTFNCSGANDISLKLLVDNIVDEIK